MKIRSQVVQQWYDKSWWCFSLWPLSIIFRSLVGIRRLMYKHKLKEVVSLPVPVVVVGNISVGGTGKTPTVIALAKELIQLGYCPGIISRGYKSKLKGQCLFVDLDSDVDLVGDEPLLLRRKSGCPVAVGADRVAAARLLLSKNDINVIVSDDGLQHYRLSRDVEVVLFHGQDFAKNNLLLPAGPYREPKSRLQQADFILSRHAAVENSYSVSCSLGDVRRLSDGQLFDFCWLQNKNIHAVCAIGSPQRFFKMLTEKGLTFTSHVFPDHYHFQPEDLCFHHNAVILMTEKDAVKCLSFSTLPMYSVALETVLENSFISNLVKSLKLI
jgi:tetraacyldisaccharide 4'-kinase